MGWMCSYRILEDACGTFSSGNEKYEKEWQNMKKMCIIVKKCGKVCIYNIFGTLLTKIHIYAVVSSIITARWRGLF